MGISDELFLVKLSNYTLCLYGAHVLLPPFATMGASKPGVQVCFLHINFSPINKGSLFCSIFMPCYTHSISQSLQLLHKFAEFSSTGVPSLVFFVSEDLL